MCFIIRRRVKQIQRGERLEPAVKRIRKPVLYANEAYDRINDCLDGVIPTLSAEKNPMRIIRMRHENAFYWICEHEKVYYAMKIGTDSELYVAPKKLYAHYFEEIQLSMTIEINLKDCSRQTRENTTLYVSVFYDADERKLSLQTLNLRGIDIKDFPHDYWNVGTVDDRCNIGCCGSVRFVRKSNFPEMNLGGLEIYDTVALWTGSKTLKIFKKEDYGFTIKQMLDYWEHFWKVCGC